MAGTRAQLEERICPECGKSFIFRDHWAYKAIKNKRVVNYCSWNCMRKNERKKENDHIHERRRRSTRQRDPEDK